MSILYLNGDYIKSDEPLIHHQDSGFTTGIGIFDSMLAIDRKPVHLQDHLERIMYDSKMVIGLTPDLKDFENIIHSLLEKNNITNPHARIRTTITGGVVDTPLMPALKLTVLIDVAPCTPPPETPIKCAVIKGFPRIAGYMLENCKRLDYSRSYAARRKAETFGAEEAILINTDGNIACGATSNIFIEENGVLITPPLTDGVLAGVTRKNIVKERNVREETISLDRLRAADKIYLTNSFISLRKVHLI